MKEDFKWSGQQYSMANGLQAQIGAQLLNNISFTDDASVLDAGCGSGNLTFSIAAQVPNGHVVAIDLSESMIEKCKDESKKNKIDNISFRVQGINDIDYNEEFDIIFSNSVLHWVLSMEDAAGKLYKALRNNGIAALQFPLLDAQHPLISYANRVIEEMQIAEYYIGWKFPWYVPTSEEFQNILINAGFDNVKVLEDINIFKFENAEAVYQHFQSVGLKLYADILPENKREEYMKTVLEDLRSDFSGEADLTYHRLFAYANK